jgi:hypothetical protein
VALSFAAQEWGKLDVWSRIGRAAGILGEVITNFFDLGDWIRKAREQARVFKADLVLNVVGEVQDLDTRLPNYKADDFVGQKVYNAKYSVLVTEKRGDTVVPNHCVNLASFNLAELSESPERAVENAVLARSRDHYLTDSALLAVSNHGVNVTTPNADKFHRLLSLTRAQLTSPESHLAFSRSSPIFHDVFIMQSMHLLQDPHGRLSSEPLVK